MSKTQQLTLPVQLPDDETFSSFKSKSNEQVISQLENFVARVDTKQPNQPNSFYLFGLTGVGKSHLLHACSALATELGKTSVCLSCSELQNLPVAVLDGLEHINLICLDDIQVVANNKVWQQAIFDLYNRVLEQDNCLLVSGDQSVQNLGLALPDLVSRLNWGLTEQIRPLTDDEKVIALQYRAGQRGLMLSNDVAKYLLSRLSREMSNLIESLDVLDKASIREQRKITIPFAKDVLKLA